MVHYGDHEKPAGEIVRQPVEPKKTIELGRTGKPKRVRNNFTDAQVNQLESIYKSNQYIAPVLRSEVAEKMNLSERRIKVWFQNRRMKDKREHIIPSTVQAPKGRQLSPSQSLTSDASSPASYRTQSPVNSHNNKSAQQYHDDVAKFLQYRYSAPQKMAATPSAYRPIHRPMYETCAPSSIQTAAPKYPVEAAPIFNLYGGTMQYYSFIQLPNDKSEQEIRDDLTPFLKFN